MGFYIYGEIAKMIAALFVYGSWLNAIVFERERRNKIKSYVPRILPSFQARVIKRQGRTTLFAHGRE